MAFNSKYEDVQVMRYPKENSGKLLKKFMKVIEEKYDRKFEGYKDFHKWTVEYLEEFWTEMWEFTGVIASKKYDKVIDLSVPMNEPPEWFSGSRLNIAENLLKYRDDHVALICA
ncbi:acetoacetyl-CoA synthetase-like, partial [Parasteatoda tepidariorum]|uniref:acetoacetyl-CoA synthetase-like n=1 Tax=Parasteatoda tepidariorum TaxID=114398 RepID=UPI001C71CD14